MLAAIGSLLGTGLSYLQNRENNKVARDTAAQNIALQREFAQNGISWKVQDAKNSGIHPLFALGAQTTSFSPVSVGQSSADFSGLKDAGQSIDRAVQSASPQAQRLSALTGEMQAAQVEGAKLDNDIKRAELASRLARRATNPPMPINQRYHIDGQGSGSTPKVDGTLVQDQPLKRVSSAPEKPEQEAGSIADLGYSRTADGYAPVFSKDVQERLEDDIFGMIAWNIRNRMGPTFGLNMNPPPVKLPPGYRWYFNPIRQSYEMTKAPTREQWYSRR